MRGIDIEKDFENSYKLLVNNFFEIVPTFSLMVGVSIVLQLIVVIGGFLGAFSFMLNNSFLDLIDAFNARNFTLVFGIIKENPFFLAIVASTIILVVLVGVIGFSAVYGGFLELIKRSTEEGELKIGYGLRGVKKNTKKIFKLHLLLLMIILVYLVPITFLINISPVLTTFYSLFVVISLLLIYFVLFFFAKEAIVFNDSSLIESIKKGTNFVSNNLLEVFFYIVLFLIATLIMNGINLTFSAIFKAPIRGLTNALMIFLIYPFFLTLKMSMYMDWEEAEIGVVEKISLKESLLSGSKKSLRKLKLLLRENVHLILFSLFIFMIGGYLGCFYGASLPKIRLPNLGIDFSSPIFFHLMFHNLTTAAGVVFSGFFFGLPTVGALLFNGIVVGFVVSETGGLNALLFGILPHGIIEIPALAIAGGFGLRLGINAFKTYNGKMSLVELGDKIKEISYAIAGTIPLFLLAALIESFITPWLISVFTNIQ